jgi:hypothetical protein
MEPYKGKAICGFNCTKRAKFRGLRSGVYDIAYACLVHSDRIEHLPPTQQDTEHYTEADYQTWMRL